SLAVAARDGTIEVADFAHGTRRRWRAGGSLAGLSVSGDGKQMVSYGDHVELWSRDGSGHRAPPREFGWTGTADFSCDGNRIAFGGADRVLHLWSVEPGTLREYSGHERDINWLAFSYDGKRVATASRDSTIRVWDLDSSDNIVLRG